MTLLKAAVSHAHPPQKRKIDLIDRKILYELEQNCRRSLSDIARKVRLSKQTLHYRISRLVKEGIITQFVAILDTSKLGLINHEVWIQLDSLSESKKQNFIDYLVKHPNTRWVVSCGGKADIAISISSTSIVSFDSIWQEILQEYPNYVKSYFVNATHQFFTYPRAHLMGTDENKEVSALGGEPKKMDLDKIEINILRSVAQDAQISIIKLAKKIKVTENTVRSKLKRLEKEGIIKTYSAIVQPTKLGLINFEVLAVTQNVTKEKLKELESYCLLNPYINYYLRLVGRFDTDISFDAVDNEHFQKQIVEFRSRFSDIIKEFDFFYILYVHKFDYFAGFVD